MEISGVVTSGTGKCKHRDWSQAEKDIGYIPYPGTLNVVFDEKLLLEEEYYKITLLDRWWAIPCKIQDIDCYILKLKTREPDEAYQEYPIASSVFLRDTLNLKDGDAVIIEY